MKITMTVLLSAILAICSSSADAGSRHEKKKKYRTSYPVHHVHHVHHVEDMDHHRVRRPLYPAYEIAPVHYLPTYRSHPPHVIYVPPGSQVYRIQRDRYGSAHYPVYVVNRPYWFD